MMVIVATAGDLLRRKYWSKGRFRYSLSQLAVRAVRNYVAELLLPHTFFTESWYSSWIQISHEEIFIDIGANIGYYSTRLSGRAAAVLAFEPNPIVYNELKAKVRYQSNVFCYPYALSNRNGISPLYLFDQDSGSSLSTVSQKSVLVKSVKLDDLLDELPVAGRRVGLIKIDVEGQELQVLEGAQQTIRRHKPRILLEVFGDQKAYGCAGFLQGNGYYLRTLKRYPEWQQWWFVATPIADNVRI